MSNYLEKILIQKSQEVAALNQNALYKALDRLPQTSSLFKCSLRQNELAIIAEIKRCSPSRGHLAPIEDITALAQAYLTGGAQALSILTDQTFFGGSLYDFDKVAHFVSAQQIPLLRKDFIIDELQIIETKLHGAHAVLIIMAAVHEGARGLISFAKSLQMDVLVEVHSADELQMALDAGADIIGVNNRNLHTFSTNLSMSFELIQHIPKHVVRVAESGISTPAECSQLYAAGFDAVLIGEALVKSVHPQQFIEQLRGVYVASN